MMRVLPILLLLLAVLALPFALRPEPELQLMSTHGPLEAKRRLAVITPHNEAIRSEFGRAFEDWHLREHGSPVRVDWIVIGGTSEIARFLASESTSAYRAWRLREGRGWPAGAAEAALAKVPPTDPELALIWRDFRAIDDPTAFDCGGVDLFFGGGEYDHGKAAEQGLLVAPWPEGLPRALQYSPEGREWLPKGISGDIWRGAAWFGNAVSTFGIVFNRDRLRDLGVAEPREWSDLADPRLRGQVGLADPTKSSSIAKAFEGLIQQAMARSAHAAGFDDAAIERHESTPEAAPPEYQVALDRGWEDGWWLLLRLGANARYFTPSSQRVPHEVAMGETAAGIAIDFYGRFQSQFSPAYAPDRVGFMSPAGGTGVTCDPISLLRGAPEPELARRFIEFTLSEEGQRLWCYRPGTPGGPAHYALRRLPIRRDFYPSEDPQMNERFEQHKPFLADDFADPTIGAYALAESWRFRPRWTARHFAAHRDLVRAACLDAGVELRAAWSAVLDAGGPDAPANAAAVAAMRRLPSAPWPLSWESAPTITGEIPRREYLRAWTADFRAQFELARALAGSGGEAP
ncbi:MAG: ABC transporter substrate-binding protein [Planctomycetota bacterium]|nr:ABC transporter substrate-binding protein [Planctomycetota bacterium]